MKLRRLIILGLAYLAVGRPGPAEAGPVLSFDRSSYTISEVGQTVQVQVFLAQTPGGVQIGPNNALLSAGIQVSFNNPSGVAAVLSTGAITPGPGFNSSSSSVSSTQATLANTALPGIGSLPVLLGTFTFTGLQRTSTQISVAAISPGPSFTTTGGDLFVPTPATASMTVLPAPSSSVIALTGVPLLIGGLALRRRRPRASSAP